MTAPVPVAPDFTADVTASDLLAGRCEFLREAFAAACGNIEESECFLKLGAEIGER